MLFIRKRFHLERETVNYILKISDDHEIWSSFLTNHKNSDYFTTEESSSKCCVYDFIVIILYKTQCEFYRNQSTDPNLMTFCPVEAQIKCSLISTGIL